MKRSDQIGVFYVSRETCSLARIDLSAWLNARSWHLTKDEEEYRNS